MSKNDTKEICKIININKDACDFYNIACEKAENVTVKDVFRKFENLHKDVMVNLQNYVRKNGDMAEADDTVVGQVQKMWGELKAKISNDVDESLITSLEEAEDRCLHSIEDALEDKDISAAAKAALTKEKATLQQTHNYMKIMKDNAKAA